MNKVTHYIDGSAIYGSTMEQQQKLRAFEGGRLSVFEDFGREFLPLNHDPDACLTTEQGSACYASGEISNSSSPDKILNLVNFRRHQDQPNGFLSCAAYCIFKRAQSNCR